MLQLVVYRSDVGTCLSEPTLKYNEVVDNPYSNHCQATYETAARFVGECGRYAALR